jgi:menaquinone-dependent protoporphyrinogen oxidase
MAHRAWRETTNKPFDSATGRNSRRAWAEIAHEGIAMHVLVTTASKHGATTEIGQMVAATLERNGHSVETRAAGRVQSIDQFDAIVLGAAVYAGRWIKDAHRFVDRFESELATRPVWVFSSGPTGTPPKPEPDDVVELGDVIERLTPKETMVFGGRLDSDVLSFAERAIIRAVSAEEGDFRDWDAIQAWAEDIAAELAAAPSRTSPAG